MPSSQRSFSPIMILLVACIIGMFVYYIGMSGKPADSDKKAEAGAAQGDLAKDSPASGDTVDLNDRQLTTIKVAAAGERLFKVKKKELGSVAYHEKEAAEAPAKAASKVVVANILESDSPLVRLGQRVSVTALVYPGRVFAGKVSALGVSIYDSGGNPAVDPTTHRIAVRCEVEDPKNELYPGMLASVSIEVSNPVTSVAVPQEGVVREGDGTMTVWVTSDHHHFNKRAVTVGLEDEGYDQILNGLKAGELVATENAVFLSNMNNTDTDSP